MEIYVRVRKYGGTHKDRVGSIPYKAEDFMQVIQESLQEIPSEYRSEATISIEPEYEHGEHFDCLEIGFRRKMTEGELAEHRQNELLHWQDQLREAEVRSTRCREQIASLAKD